MDGNFVVALVLGLVPMVGVVWLILWIRSRSSQSIKVVSLSPGAQAYRDALADVLSDDFVSEEELAKLSKVGGDLDLSATEVHAAHVEACRALWIRYSADDRMSQEEKAALQDTTGALDVQLEEIGFDQGKFNRAHLLDRLEKGIGPVEMDRIEGLPVILKPGERYLWCCPSALRKYKTVTTRVSYSSVTTSIRIMKGVRWRTGSFRPRVSRSEYLGVDDTGWLWLSTDRVGFHGQRKHFSFKYSQMASFEATEEGLRIAKQGREAPYLILPDEFDVPCAVISWVLNQRAEA